MLQDVLKIAVLCIVLGGASIPLSFSVNPNPFVVWFGNALGSLISAAFVIYVGNRLTSNRFKKKISEYRLGKKIIIVFDKGPDNKKTKKANLFINKYGLRLFSLLCPIFPGVLISTALIYTLDLNKTVYKRWMFTGVFFVSGAYVVGYWWLISKA